MAFVVWVLLRLMAVVLMITVGVFLIVNPDNIERWVLGLPAWHFVTVGLLAAWTGLTLAALPLIGKMRLDGRSSGIVSAAQTAALVVSAVLWALLFGALAGWQRSIASHCASPVSDPRSGFFAPCPGTSTSGNLRNDAPPLLTDFHVPPISSSETGSS
ncbi:MAG: hypothetical protein ACTIJY_01455 [Luteimonas sp.]